MIGMMLADEFTGIISKELIEYLKKKQVKLLFTGTDQPSSNEMIERLDQTLVNRLRCKKNERNHKNISWHKLMKECVDEYNETPHSIRKFSPKYLLFGIEEDKPMKPVVKDCAF